MTSAVTDNVGRTDLDMLELELRRVPGIEFVGFTSVHETLTVHVRTSGTGDLSSTRRLAWDVSRRYVHEPFALQFDVNPRPARVRLLAVREVQDEGTAVEVHLELGAARTVGRGPADDPHGAASATVEALTKLGVDLPFEVAGAAVFQDAWGEGVLLVLQSDRGGRRFGVAGGETLLHAAARATLHALNRHLAAPQFAS